MEPRGVAVAAMTAAAGLGLCYLPRCMRNARHRAGNKCGMPSQLSPGQVQAAQAAVVGCLVADSAAVTSHWVYDQTVIAEHVNSLGGKATESAAFMEPINPFYHVPVGAQSCYGDQTIALLRCMAKTGPGMCDLSAFMRELDDRCGENSAYGPLGRVVTQADYPIAGPWRHGSLKKYFANIAEGKSSPQTSGSDDKQIDGACKVAPIVASYAAQGLGPTLVAVEAAVRVTQDTDEAVAMALAFARILYSVVTDSSETARGAAYAVSQCIEALRDENRLQPNQLDKTVADALEDALQLATDVEGPDCLAQLCAAGQKLGLS